MEKIKSFFMQNRNRSIAILSIVVFLICSLTLLGDIFTNPYTYSDTIRSLDEKKITVLGVSAAIAGSATLLAALPEDSTTPLAEELMDLSSWLLIVVCIIVLEKSLLTVFGAISCYIFIPAACILGIFFIVKKKQIFMTWAIKLAVFALALLIVVPTAMKISDYIYEVNQVKIEQKVDESTKPTEPETDTETDTETGKKNKPWWQKVWDSVTDAVSDAADALTGAVQKALDKGKEALSNFTDAVAIFVIAYCAIPILIVFLFIWLLKYLFNIKININPEKLNMRQIRKKLSGKSIQEENNLMLKE